MSTPTYEIRAEDIDGQAYHVVYMDGAPIDQSTSPIGARDIVRNLRRADREAMTPAQRCERLVEILDQLDPEVTWTFGYIGNLSHERDDRAWYAFASHPGRVGRSDDRIGGLPTENLDQLAERLAGAVTLARVFSARH